MNINIKIIGSTRLEIKPEVIASEADALTTRPFELFKIVCGHCDMKMAACRCVFICSL